jgi:uncharacterized membrane protein YtjA (UPF0391 family)
LLVWRDGLLMEAASTPDMPQRTIQFTSAFHQRGATMLYYALMFLVVGLIAGALNLAGISTVVVQISWILVLAGILVMGAIHLIMGRTSRTV